MEQLNFGHCLEQFGVKLRYLEQFGVKARYLEQVDVLI